MRSSGSKSCRACRVSARSFLFFFFQAEDGIRDLTVTGVQTCALPILVLEINGGDAVLAREHAGDVVVGDKTHSGKAASQLATIGALELQSLLELIQIGRASCRERV